MVGLFLSGCAVLDAIIPKSETPKTPSEFRKNFSKGHASLVKKSYVIKRPYSYVVNRWKKRTKSCLNKRIKRTIIFKNTIFNKTQVSYDDYRAKLKTYRKKAVLSLQFEQTGEGVGSNAINPPGGAYYMVLDAYPLKGKRTRVIEYRWNLPLSNFGVVSKAILNWGSGKSTACPDFQKIFG